MERFSLDRFVEGCQAAVVESDRVGAIRAALDRVAAAPSTVTDELGSPEAGSLRILHHAPDLTVLDVVWTPSMVIGPHDHRMLAGIVVYGGSEDNAYFRRLADGTVERAGGRTLEAGEVAVLGADMIHRVRADAERYTGALHVYAGDFFDRERSTWDEDTGQPTVDERPPAQLFAEAEAAYRERRRA